MTMPTQKPGRSKQDYGTPPEFLQAVKNRLRIKHFAIDLAATASNRVGAIPYFNEEINSLGQDWCDTAPGWSWLNPPFSDITPWVKKAADSALNGASIAMLVPASVGSNWWYNFVEPYAYQVFLNGRITFVGQKDPYPKDCALLLYQPWGMTGHETWAWKNWIDKDV